MTRNIHTSLQPKSMPLIDLWSMVYLGIVYSLTLFFEQANIIVFIIYFVGAMPFIYHLDKYLCICFLLSTMSYYFLGADEGVWSLYTILALLMVVQMLTKAKIKMPLKSTLYLLWLFLAVIISYVHSSFEYSMGMFAMIYNIVIALLIALSIEIRTETVVSFLPKVVVFQVLAFIGMLLLNGHYDGYGFSVSEKINHNTFGSSVAVLAVILFVRIMFFKDKSLIYRIMWIVSIILIFISGSRNALLATILTSIFVYMVAQKQKGKTISGVLKFALGISIIVFLGGLLLPEIGVDLSRYNYVELISSGGSNRTIIWETLSPIIWEKHKWFGYGPGHFCSENMILKFMNLDYKHTHNTLFEAWGELGFFGLIPFLLMLIGVYKKSNHHMKKNNAYLMFGFLFIEYFILGLGESFFANIAMWIVIGIILGSTKTHNSQEDQIEVNKVGISND